LGPGRFAPSSSPARVRGRSDLRAGAGRHDRRHSCRHPRPGARWPRLATRRYWSG
jgi:hypothetical protein